MIVWTKEFEIGIELIDTQHKGLINLINECERLRAEGSTNEDLHNILKSLVEYTNVHFSSEEDLMEKFRYPFRAEHRSLHKILVRQIIKVIGDIKSGNQFALDNIVDMLNNWIVKHVLEHDQEFGEFMRTRYFNRQK